MKPWDGHEFKVALEAMVAAARLCQAVRRELVTADTISKQDKSPVSVADFGAQALILKMLSENFPQDAVLAEEDSFALRRPENKGLFERVCFFVSRACPGTTPEDILRWVDWGKRTPAPRHWCLDPIDGTKGFLRGDQYAIALALISNGIVHFGALACPNLPWRLDKPQGRRGVIFYAVRGHGAFQRAMDGPEEESLSLRRAAMDPSQLRMCESFEPAHSDQQAQQEVARRLGIEVPPIRMDSQAKYGLVARGDVGVYLRLPNPGTPGYSEKVWDHAAGSIIVEEAGGEVTDTLGRPLAFGLGDRLSSNVGILATIGGVHTKVLEVLESMRRGKG